MRELLHSWMQVKALHGFQGGKGDSCPNHHLLSVILHISVFQPSTHLSTGTSHITAKHNLTGVTHRDGHSLQEHFNLRARKLRKTSCPVMFRPSSHYGLLFFCTFHGNYLAPKMLRTTDKPQGITNTLRAVAGEYLKISTSNRFHAIDLECLNEYLRHPRPCIHHNT